MKKNVDSRKVLRSLRVRELARLTAVYAIATLVVLGGLAAYFNVIYASRTPQPTGTPTPPGPTSTPTASPTPSPTPPWIRSFTLPNLPADPETLVFTEDGTRAAALKAGAITVLDIPSGDVVETITAPAPIAKCFLMVDQDILVYFYIDPKSLDLEVCTYNFGTTVHYVRQSVPFPAGTEIKLVDYCKGMSFTVYETTTTSGSSTTWSLGWLNTASHIRTTPIHHPMLRMMATNLIYHIYSETPWHALYYGTGPVSALKGKKVQLMGIDAMDTCYALSLDDGTTVYAVKNGVLQSSFQLPAKDPAALFTDKISVFAAYDGYVVDLLAKTTNRLDIPTGLTYVYVAGQELYFEDAQGTYYVFAMPFA